jgi:hypothetical protein
VIRGNDDHQFGLIAVFAKIAQLATTRQTPGDRGGVHQQIPHALDRRGEFVVTR